MRYNAWATVLIGLSALCLTACSVSRKATSSHSEQVRVESVGLRDSSDVERVEVHDTITITRTITVQTNDKGDTLRVNTETDRERIRSKADVRRQKVETKVIRDTVYVEKRDSSLRVTAYGLQEDGTPTVSSKLSAVSKVLKWIFWILIGLIGLIITMKVCTLMR